MKYAPPPPEPVDPALEKALLARFQRIQAAYDVLSVPEKRQVYDKEMLADEEMSLFGERKALREARGEAWRAAHPPPPPVPETPADVKPPFVWDADRKQPLFWDPNPQPNPTPPSDEPGMQLIRKEDAAACSKYIFTREAAVKRLVEINDENYGAYKFIKGVSLGAVELQSKDLVPVRQRGRRRFDLAATPVTPEPVSAQPEATEIPGPPMPEPPKKADIRRASQIVRLAQAMTTADMHQARLKLEREQALLTQIEAVKAQEEVHRLRVERERQRAQLELQMRMAMIEKERERIRAEEELEKLRVEQAKLAAATAQLSAQMSVWPQQVTVTQVTQKPQRPRVSSDVGRQRQDIWPKEDAGDWGNIQPTGAEAGWGTTWDGGWDNPNYHQPLRQTQENRKSRMKERNPNNAWEDDWGAQPPAKDIIEINRKTRSRSKSFSVGVAETKQHASLRERADYREQTQPGPEEKHQPRKLTKPAKVRFDMVDVPPQFRPYEPPEEPKATLSGFKRLFGRA